VWLVGAATWITAQGALPGVEPLHDAGQDVTPAFEGWYQNPDGTYEMVFGYQNRNLKEEVDIPIGPGNRIEPGGPDQGQPTHFLTRRQWGLFTVTVPKDFGTTKKVTWTLTLRGRTNAIPGHLDRRWEVDSLKDGTVGNTPPVIRFVQGGASGQGPKPLMSTATARVGSPLVLDLWATDDAKSRTRNPTGAPIRVTWAKYRGTGDVVFDKPKPDVEKDTGRAATTATFATPGEYTLRAQVNDYSGEGGGGFQCCWTNVHVKVNVQ